MRPALHVTSATCALFLALSVVWSQPAAACKKTHQDPFSLFDEAGTVALVRVRSAPARARAGQVELAVLATLKGTADKKVTLEESNTSCRVGFRRGDRGVVFLGADGGVLGIYEGFLRGDDTDTWRAALERYGAATDGAGRLGALVAAAGSASERVAHEAALALVDRPELLLLADADARDALMAALDRAAERSALPLVLARLREARVLPALKKRKFQYGEIARKLLAVGRFEDVSDREVLATAIERGKDYLDPDRIAAMERCERVVGRRLESFLNYSDGVPDDFWLRLADACRSGKPAR